MDVDSQTVQACIVKSDADYKDYRFITLPNGLRVMLISSLKPGETPEPQVTSDADEADIHEEDFMVTNDGEDKKGLRKSAAALCINVGYFSDPGDAQGLAHFLEHMVFMGSEKYPRENDFDDYVCHRDGCNNACTDGDYTMFFFDIQQSHFKLALDKFANFFVAPLLSKDCVDRELEAVHSEFELYKADDTWRLAHIVSSFAKEGSPYRNFSTGNRTSLKDMPNAAGTNVYELLRKFQLRYYSAPLMTLAIESKDSLEFLESLVSEIFGCIPNRTSQPPDLSPFINPFPSTVYKKIYKICPMKDTISMSFIWSLPPMHSQYRSAALKFVASIVGYEGRGSLIAYLRNLNLAVELNAGCSVNDSTHHNPMTSLFAISVDLSELGRLTPITEKFPHRNWKQFRLLKEEFVNFLNKPTVYEYTGMIADHVFSYLRMLRLAADFSLSNPSATTTPLGQRTFASLVPEFEKLWASTFRFREPLEPITNVQTIASAMRKFPPHEVFIADSLMLEPDLKSYVDLVHHLTPDKAIIVVCLPEFNAQAMRDIKEKVFHTEPWFGIRYAIDDISEEQIQKWETADPLPDFHLPEVNRFITTNFDLLPREDDDEVPYEIALGTLQPYGQLWHQKRVKFNVPNAHVVVHLYSDIPRLPKDTAILQLWASALNQRLQTLFYSATEAGLSFMVTALDRGLELVVTGFNEKLLLLYQEIIDVLAQPLTGEGEEFILTRESFAVYKDRLRQKTCNRVLDPSKLNTHIRRYFSQVNVHLVEDCMKALESLSLKNMVAFVSKFKARLYVKAFVYGNITASEAKPYFDYTLSALSPKEAATMEPYPKAALPACINRLRLMNFNKTDVNTCLTLMSPLQGTPSVDLRYEVMNDFLEACLREPAFAYLRTKETLGYSVALYSWSMLESTGQCGLSVCVNSQANKFDSNVVAGRIYAFWYRIVPYIIFHLKEEAFQTSVNALIASNLLEDTTMSVEINRNRNEVFSDRHVFDRRQRSVEILKNLKLSDVQAFYADTYYAFEKQPSLMIQVDSLSEVIPIRTSSRGGNPRVMRTFDWPLSVVPLSGDQVAAEREAALTVDVREAVKACASGLVIDTTDGDTDPDFSVEEERVEMTLPRIAEIREVHDFKRRCLFPL